MKSEMNLFLNLFVCLFCFTLLACGQQIGADKNDAVPKEMPFVLKSETEWKKLLTPDQFNVLREKGTEKPFSGKWLMNNKNGIYTCAACGNELFTSDMKFDAHCGWPSFDREISGGKIKTATDNSHGMSRTEIMCAKCNGHLGHLFDDGPTSTGKRYCVNSVSIGFTEKKSPNVGLEKKSSQYDTLTLGGGCYWCVEAVYEMLDGVIDVESGYSGGKVPDPTYEDVCSGNTGHAEVIQIVFDPKKTNLDEILKVFFTVHDPTTLNRQGGDRGTQYRSVIFYRNKNQELVARDIIKQLNKQKVYDDPVVTEVAPFEVFYKAENYHQNYYQLNNQKPYCKMVIQPKIEKFEKLFKSRLKKSN
jgi:peptide methionine sulfoxide reductase msrA/msrB